MNANELADELENDYWDSRANKIMLESAKMLRQQQAEIEALKTYSPNQTLECFFDLAGLKPQAKTLTNEEIIKTGLEIGIVSDEELTEEYAQDYVEDVVKFARAILRKAQEK